MSNVETISWVELTGNRFNKNLHPAMLTDEGYKKQTRTRRTGDTGATIFHVIYDRKYVIEYIGRYLCRDLFTLGKQELLDLVTEAWDTYYSEASITALFEKQK